jgi:hypothetical protein
MGINGDEMCSNGGMPGAEKKHLKRPDPVIFGE